MISIKYAHLTPKTIHSHHTKAQPHRRKAPFNCKDTMGHRRSIPRSINHFCGARRRLNKSGRGGRVLGVPVFLRRRFPVLGGVAFPPEQPLPDPDNTADCGACFSSFFVLVWCVFLM